MRILYGRVAREEPDVEMLRRHPEDFVELDGSGAPWLDGFCELVGCAVAEACRGCDRRIRIASSSDGILTIRDFGRGMNFADEPGENVPHGVVALRRTYPVPCARGQRRVFSNWFGAERRRLYPMLGNAFAERLRITSRRPGVTTIAEFRGGEVTALDRAPERGERGTEMRFEPDFRLFGGEELSDSNDVERRIVELQDRCADAGLRVELDDSGL